VKFFAEFIDALTNPSAPASSTFGNARVRISGGALGLIIVFRFCSMVKVSPDKKSIGLLLISSTSLALFNPSVFYPAFGRCCWSGCRFSKGLPLAQGSAAGLKPDLRF